MKKYIVFSLLLLSCSDKYKALYYMAPSPDLLFSREVLTVREKDNTNIRLTDKGKISLYLSDASHELNIRFIASSPAVHFLYRGQEIKSGQALVAMDRVSLFCYVDTVGVYSTEFVLTNQLGETTRKSLAIYSLTNQQPTPAFSAVLIDDSQPQDWQYEFDAARSQDPDGEIRAYHYLIDGQKIATDQSVMHWIFHWAGMHHIAMYVTDDLGKNSDTLHQTIFLH